MQHNYVKQYFAKVYLVLYNLEIGNVRLFLIGNFKWNKSENR